MWRIRFGLIVVALAACGFQHLEEPVEAMKNLARSNSEFAVALYGKLREAPGNIVFSPYSISAAMALAYDGARGDTARQMASVLRFPAQRERLHPASLQMARQLVHESNGHEVCIANALWAQHDFPYNADFQKNAKDNYGTGFGFVDFETRFGREQARRAINDWTRQSTGDKIREILSSDDLDSGTRLVLTNAIYFKGLWATPFEETRTKPMPFHCSADRVVTAPMMQNHQGRFPYVDADDVSAVELPYRGERAGFVVLLPSSKSNLAEFEKSLTAKKLADLMGMLKPEKIGSS